MKKNPKNTWNTTIRFNSNIFIWQIRFPFGYITVTYSTEDTEIMLGQTEDLQAWELTETPGMTNTH